MSMSLEEALGLPLKKGKQLGVVSPKKLRLEVRREQVITLLRTCTPTRVAELLGVCRSTVYEDFNWWTKNRQVADLQMEWLRLGEEIKQEDKKLVYQGLTKLLSKVFEKQAQISVSVNQEINPSPVSIDVKALLSEYDQLFSGKEVGVREAVVSKDCAL